MQSDWRHGVTYQIYVKSFADGNGDGIGDLTGLLAHIDHIASLNVDAVWLSPWFVSPMADGGYDVADYRNIEPMFGSLEQAQLFIDSCHERNIKVMLDLVANHCSNEHPWFVDALTAAPGSPARERFYFRDGRGVDGNEPPTDWVSVFGGRAWTRITEADGTPGQWYLHLFDSGQPDLNWHNQEVRDDFADIFRFWFARGVDGFRLDAVPAIGKDLDFADVHCDQSSQFTPDQWPQMPFWDAGDVHDVVREWRVIADSYAPAKYLVGEINVNSTEALLRYLRPGEMQSVFAFDLTKSPWDAAAFRQRIDATRSRLSGEDSWPTWVLSSHDETRTVTRFARLENGSLDVALGTNRAKAALLLTFALPGAVCLYQGEELGLPQVEDLPRELLEDPIVHRTGDPTKGRDGCRVPLPWDDSSDSFGYSATGASWLPQPRNWNALTIDAQNHDKLSFLSFTRALISARAAHVVDLPDEVKWCELGDDIVAFDRGSLRCVLNASSAPVTIDDQWSVLVASRELVDGVLLPNHAVWLIRT